MDNFSVFAQAVEARFNQLAQQPLFVTDVTGDQLWDAYLAAFPTGTNPLFRERTEHDCSCCRQFIRNIGNLIAVEGTEALTVWDLDGLPYPYDVVAATLHSLISRAPIQGRFSTKEHQYGNRSTIEQLPDGNTRRWHHFHVRTQGTLQFSTKPDQCRGEYATTVQVFQRGLTEISVDAVETVLSLIADNNLYRGEEFRAQLKEFQQLQEQYTALNYLPGNRFLWDQALSRAARIRNSAIGTLLQDLSAGMGLESAVKVFEQKVAPTNYKRPSALITPRMIQDAMQTLKELDLEAAVERRLAQLSDLSVNNVLWVDNSVQGQMKDGIAGLLMEEAIAPTPKTAQAVDIGVEVFLRDVVPTASSMSVLVKNTQMGNFMTLTAPVHADSGRLFKWDNNFAWSYDGNITDSIKERVKAAGGRVEGDLCCRLAWDYRDDLDFHMYEPGGGHIFFGNRRTTSACGGVLDLDANGADGLRNDPAENIVYPNQARMKEGVYRLAINNYCRRDPGKKGFEVEIELNGQTHHIVYDQVLRDSATLEVAQIRYSHARGLELIKSLPASLGSASKQKWGVSTEGFTPVTTLLASPNHWDGQAIGNKHWFFILKDCHNPEPVRGLYNEFLDTRLEKHRKVFEVLGRKLMCPVSDDQLSGVGFSSTRGDTVLVQVTSGNRRITYNLSF